MAPVLKSLVSITAECSSDSRAGRLHGGGAVVVTFTLCFSTRCSSFPRDEAFFPFLPCALTLQSCRQGLPGRPGAVPLSTELNSVLPHVDVSYRSLYYKACSEWWVCKVWEGISLCRWWHSPSPMQHPGGFPIPCPQLHISLWFPLHQHSPVCWALPPPAAIHHF